MYTENVLTQAIKVMGKKCSVDVSYNVTVFYKYRNNLKEKY